MFILFYGNDGQAAKVAAAEGRAAGAKVRVLDCYACHEKEDCQGLKFMPDVPAFERQRLERLFEVEPEAEPVAETEIPQTWRSMHHKTRVSLAKKLGIAGDPTTEDADEFIASVVEQRGG